MRIGLRLRLHGLQRADLNGKTGRACSWHADTERVGVQLDLDAAGSKAHPRLLVRLVNLEEVAELVTVGTDALGSILVHLDLLTSLAFASTCKPLNISISALLALQDRQCLGAETMATMQRMRAIAAVVVRLPRLCCLECGEWILSMKAVRDAVNALDATEVLDASELFDSDVWTEAHPGVTYGGTVVADMLLAWCVAASLSPAEPSVRNQARLGCTSDGTIGPVAHFKGSLAQIAQQVASGELYLSEPEVMLLGSLYLQTDAQAAQEDWDQLVEAARRPGWNQIKWNPYRYYKDEDQLHLDFSMTSLGDVGGLMLAAKLRFSLPPMLHPAENWSFLQRLLVSRCRLGTAGFMGLVDALHVIGALVRLQRWDASENQIGDAAVLLLCTTLQALPPEPGPTEKLGDDEYYRRPDGMDRLQSLDLNKNPLTDLSLAALTAAADAGALTGFSQGTHPYLGLMGGRYSAKELQAFEVRCAEVWRIRPCFG